MNEILLLKNGRIYPSADRGQTIECLVISGDLILDAGDSTTLREWEARAHRTIDLQGAVVFPGFTDAHIHLEKYAHARTQVNCETATLEECLARVREAAQSIPEGDWIRGHGWDQNSWGRFGSLSELNAVSPNNPVYLTAKSLHAAWVNGRAISMAPFPASGDEVAGGRVGRHPDGKPTGILFEDAMKLVSDVIPRPTPSQTRAAIMEAQSTLLHQGITSIHDFDGQRCFSALQELHRDGELHIRVTKNILKEQLEAAIEIGLQSGFGDEWLRIGHLKLFSDGALGPQTAAMLAPYESQQENQGLLLLSEDEIVDVGIKASAAGLPLTVHAIGDLACRTVIAALTKLNKLTPTPVLPHRIEHLQVIHPADLEHLPGSNITISMQPLHAPSDHQTAEHYWGARCDWAYAWKSVISTGSLLIFGSDAPVETPDPFQGLYAAVTRKLTSEDPKAPVWVPEQNLDLRDALMAYTVNPHIAVGNGHELGRLLQGYKADLIVLDRDPYSIELEEIPSLKVKGAMTGGQWRFLNV